MHTTIAKLESLLPALDQIEKSADRKHVLTGFDGFVDRIKRPVSSRAGVEVHWFRTLSDFAARIQSAAGRSGQIEMVTEKTKPGGNGPLLAETLGKCRIDCLCIGAMGYPQLHNIFARQQSDYRILSILEPGRSDAVEFDDGKIIFSELSVFDHYNWTYVRRTAGIEKLRTAVEESNLIAFVDWANLPHSADIWRGLLEEVIRPLGTQDRIFLFDLCDPSRKTDEQVREVLELIGRFSDFGRVVLGLNENEATRIFTAVFSAQADVRTAAGRLFNHMQIDTLLVHPVDRCIVCRKDGVTELEGWVIREPRVLTGGGDNLNAGFCLGLLHGLDMEACVLLGMAASGAYVQRGFSPGVGDLKSFVKGWIREMQAQTDSVSQNTG